MKIALLIFFNTLLFPFIAKANPIACAVCTVAIAGGLGISRMLGVNDIVVGVWVGAGLLALSQWTIYFLESKNIKNKIIKILCYILWYILLVPLYLGENSTLIFNLNKILWIDAFICSVLLGSLILFASMKLYYFMKARNNGKPHFPFEKVALPFFSLFLTSLILFLITRV